MQRLGLWEGERAERVRADGERMQMQSMGGSSGWRTAAGPPYILSRCRNAPGLPCTQRTQAGGRQWGPVGYVCVRMWALTSP